MTQVSSLVIDLPFHLDGSISQLLEFAMEL
jgi:hypothetical protein